MTSGTHVHTPSGQTTRQPLRLRLKPKASTTGYVDGAWWPRSRDLAEELPALAEVLAVRLGVVLGVAFALTAWDSAPRRVEIDGHPVRLEGFFSQDRNIAHVTGTDRSRLSLLVIPPGTDGEAAHTAMMTAAGRGNADSPTTILAASGVRRDELIPSPRPAFDDAEDRWEVDGGYL